MSIMSEASVGTSSRAAVSPMRRGGRAFHLAAVSELAATLASPSASQRQRDEMVRLMPPLPPAGARERGAGDRATGSKRGERERETRHRSRHHPLLALLATPPPRPQTASG